MQRVLDLILSTFALLLFSPLFVLVMLVLRITGEGKVFYVQERIGYDGIVFGLLKFATMRENSPSEGAGTVTLANDPRVLPVGRLLRKTKINEVPQLINVLRGEMSVVGPRPQDHRGFEAYSGCSQRVITTVRPGLSGVAAIAFRNEEDLMKDHADPWAFYNAIIAPQKGLLEEWYVANRSLEMYLRVIIATIVVVIIPSANVHARIFPSAPWPVAGGGSTVTR